MLIRNELIPNLINKGKNTASPEYMTEVIYSNISPKYYEDIKKITTTTKFKVSNIANFNLNKVNIYSSQQNITVESKLITNITTYSPLLENSLILQSQIVPQNITD